MGLEQWFGEDGKKEDLRNGRKCRSRQKDGVAMRYIAYAVPAYKIARSSALYACEVGCGATAVSKFSYAESELVSGYYFLAKGLAFRKRSAFH